MKMVKILSLAVLVGVLLLAIPITSYAEGGGSGDSMQGSDSCDKTCPSNLGTLGAAGCTCWVDAQSCTYHIDCPPAWVPPSSDSGAGNGMTYEEAHPPQLVGVDGKYVIIKYELPSSGSAKTVGNYIKKNAKALKK